MLGDVISQTCIPANDNARYDFVRTARFGFYGFAMVVCVEIGSIKTFQSISLFVIIFIHTCPGSDRANLVWNAGTMVSSSVGQIRRQKADGRSGENTGIRI